MKILFTLSDGPPPGLDPASEVPVYRSRKAVNLGAGAASFYRLGSYDLLRFHDAADFYLGADSIVCDPRGACRELIEIHFLGPVLAVWEERRGRPVLHASVVEAGDRAMAFLGTRGGGKTTLASALLEAGLGLLSDDLLPLEPFDEDFLCRPGYPQMRLWPDQLERLGLSGLALPRVHPDLPKRRLGVGRGRGRDGFGRFANRPRFLGALYLPRRWEAGETEGREIVEIREVKPREAVIALLQGSFAPRLVEAAGWQGHRLDLLSRAALRVPVREVAYRAGFDHLEAVAAEILRDFNAVP